MNADKNVAGLKDDDLDITELEQRLEMTAATRPAGCPGRIWIFVC